MANTTIEVLCRTHRLYSGCMNTKGMRSDRTCKGIDIFAERLRGLRKEMGFSQLELAKKVKEYLNDDSPSYQSFIGNMEDLEKRAMPSVQVLRALALILQTNTDHLLGLTDDGRPTGDMDDQVVVVVDDPEERKIVQEIAELMARATPDEKEYISGLVRKLLPKKPRIIGDE